MKAGPCHGRVIHNFTNGPIKIVEYGDGESVEMPFFSDFEASELVDTNKCSISHQNDDRCYDATGPCSSIHALREAATKDKNFTGAISNEKCTY